MALANIDYEEAPAGTRMPRHVAEPRQRRNKAARAEVDFSPLASSATAAAEAMTELARLTNEFYDSFASHSKAAGKTKGAATTPELPVDEPSLPETRKTSAAPGGTTPGPNIPSDESPQNKSDASTAAPGWSDHADDIRNRFDAVRNNIGGQRQEVDESLELLEQAVTLLESLAAHPAVTNHGALKQRLDDIEQRLNSSGNVL